MRKRRYLSLPAGMYPAPIPVAADAASLQPCPPVVPRPAPSTLAPSTLAEVFEDQDFLRDDFAAQIEEAMEREVLSPPVPAVVTREERRANWAGVGWGLLAGGVTGILAAFLLVRLIQPDLIERPITALSGLSSSELVSAGLIFLAFLFLGAGAGSRWRLRRPAQN